MDVHPGDSHAPRLSIAGIWPNPVSGGQRAFTLALDLPCDDRLTLEVIDATGRVVFRRAAEHMSAGAGRELHVETGAAGVPAAGVYYVRVETQRAGAAVAPITVLR
jgi:hypothetical protein